MEILYRKVCICSYIPGYTGSPETVRFSHSYRLITYYWQLQLTLLLKFTWEIEVPYFIYQLDLQFYIVFYL